MWEKDSQLSFELQMLDRLVSPDDKYRVLKENIDFSFINDLVKPYYSLLGREGIEPVKLFKMLLVMYLEGISSERELEDQIQYNLKYRWFCDLDTYKFSPDHSTFSKLRERLGDEVFKKIFHLLVAKALELGFVKARHLAVDSTSVIADCKEPLYDEEAQDPKTGRHNPSQSQTDPDARWGKKSKKRTFFGYKAHHLVDSETEFILNLDTTGASLKDHLATEGIIDEVIKTHQLNPQSLSGDKAYTEGSLRLTLKKRHHIQPVIPFKKERERGVFKRDKFSFDNRGSPVCPQGRKMRFVDIDARSKSLRYRGVNCNSCKLKPKCTSSLRGRTVQFSPDEALLFKDRKFNETQAFEALYKLRSSVERIHGDAKRNHSLARAKFRGKWKVNFQVIMTAIALNLKRLASWLKNGPPQVKVAFEL